jgi:DNA processing protein
MDKAIICGREMFVEGDLEIIDMSSVAIVGSRNCTERGRQITAAIATAFVKAGFVIVSGLAEGIDTAAHKGAIAAGGLTIAVLGTPINRIYPAKNESLAREIVKKGGLLCTEYDTPEYDSARAKKRFTNRDQIIVDLSDAVIPVQAELKPDGRDSGTMITARYAVQQKKPIYIPIPVKSDCEAHPDRYAGLKKLATDYVGSGFCHSFRGKQDYPTITEAIKRSRID